MSRGVARIARRGVFAGSQTSFAGGWVSKALLPSGRRLVL